MSKRRSEDENAAPAKRGGAGYIGRRKEHRFEDVGDAKARLLDSLSTKAHVGGAPTVDDGRVWCPDGWTVMTLRRGKNDRSAGQAYHQWYAPDGAKFRSRRAAERRVAGTVAVAPEHVPYEIRGRRPGPVDDRVEIKK